MVAPPGPIMKAKVCLIGEASVGKTSLIRRFVLNEFDDAYIMTLGARVSKRTVSVALPGQDNFLQVDLAVWDIMGQRGVRELLREVYFTGAQGVLAVADLTRSNTLEALSEWIDSVGRVAGEMSVVVVGNKSDLMGKREVAEADVAALARTHAAPYFLTSAKTGMHVVRAFEALASNIASRKIRAESPAA